jgi:CMP-N-acetylneuraminic acid synthetase
VQALRAGSHVFGPYWKMFFGTQFLKERPLLPRVYRPNGSIKIARLTALASSASFFGQRLSAFETPEQRSVHVAEEFDLRIGEAILNDRHHAVVE